VIAAEAVSQLALAARTPETGRDGAIGCVIIRCKADDS
jgi:hypothetical protein